MKVRFTAFACALAALAGTSQAQVIEDFEHGNEALYVPVGPSSVDTMNVVAGAAHDGSFGAEFVSGTNPAFRIRTDIPTGPGNSYIAFVRVRGGAAIGRVYLGVGASAGGAWSAVFGPNTGQIILQNNTGWAFTQVAVAGFVPAANTWYAMVLDWAANGDMTVKIMDEAMSTTLAATTPFATGFTTPGGVVLRGFSTSTAVQVDLDTIRLPGPPPCYADCNGDHALNLSDFGCFQTKFALGDPYADCNGDLVLNLSDFGCFQTKFALGCP